MIKNIERQKGHKKQNIKDTEVHEKRFFIEFNSYQKCLHFSFLCEKIKFSENVSDENFIVLSQDKKKKWSHNKTLFWTGRWNCLIKLYTLGMIGYDG